MDIQSLKKAKDAIVLAHYYVPDEVQEVADFVGDSYYLSKLATTLPQKNIILCGVYFMGESAKILSPDKRVILPETAADCPMAHMVDQEKIKRIKAQYEDVAVVCYINSTAEVKAYADVCVTSSNAVKIVRSLPNQYIYFIPDENLGRYVASKVPEKTFIFGDGFCHVHTSITAENLKKAKACKPDALILAHPECTNEVLQMADYIGSTSGIIEYAKNSQAEEFIICTELGVLRELKKNSEGKRFYSVGHRQYCPNMKKVTLAKVVAALENLPEGVTLDDEISKGALGALENMLTLAK